MVYIARSDIEDVFGVFNVSAWADLDGDGDTTKIAARVARFIAIAEARLDDRFRDGPYLVPIQGNAGVPAALVYIAARVAGAMIYMNRGPKDGNMDTDRIASLETAAWAEVDAYMKGTRRLNAASSQHGAGDAPRGPATA